MVEIACASAKEFKENGKGIDIQYGIHQTPFGECLIANTTRGICALEFTEDNSAKAIQQFKARWKNANITIQQETTERLIKSYFEKTDEPLKVLLLGTEFQLKVWKQLVQIPYGTVCSYASIAQSINQAKAYRAVGNTIGRNTIALLIPCHRVIPTQGGIGEYKWGKARKQAIIDSEKS